MGLQAKKNIDFWNGFEKSGFLVHMVVSCASKVLDMFKNDAHSLGTIFKHAGVYTELDLPKTENETSNLSLLQSTAFENNILMFIITSYATEKAHYDPLMKHLNDILSLLEKEIEP